MDGERDVIGNEPRLRHNFILIILNDGSLGPCRQSIVAKDPKDGNDVSSVHAVGTRAQPPIQIKYFHNIK